MERRRQGAGGRGDRGQRRLCVRRGAAARIVAAAIVRLAPAAAIGVEFHQERIQAEHGRHHERAAVAILNVSGMNDGMYQQALRINENVALLALDLLSRVVARRINRSPPFSALLTLWLSITAAVGLASLPIASRHFT